MKLSECTHGKLVYQNNTSFDDKGNVKVGMVIGITQNCCEEAIPMVQWQDGNKFSAHHANLSLYEE